MVNARKTSSYLFNIWLTLALFAAFLISFAFYIVSEKKTDRANDLRYQSLMLVNELRQSSYDQTKMAHNYVLTANPIYKQYFNDIRDIRDGKKPRPQDYTSSYWVLALANKQPPLPQAPYESGVSLLEMMRRTGISEQEFRILLMAKTSFDALTDTELKAMAMVEPAGSSTALAMLLDDKYNQTKADIVQPVNEFYELIDKRAQTAVEQAKQNASLTRLALLGFGLSLMFMLWRISQALRMILGGSIAEVYTRIAHIGSGDFTADMSLTNTHKDSVLGWLAQTQRNLHQIDQERLQAETAKRDSDARYRTLFNRAQVGIVIFLGDTNSFLVDANACFCDMLGYNLAELLQLRPADVVATAEVEFIAPAIDIIESKTDYFREWQLKRKDGSTFPAEVISTTMPDGTMMSIICDITERKLAQVSLRNSEENLAITLQSIGDAVIATDAAGAITRMNPTAEHLTGWRLTEVLGHQLTGVFHIISAQTRLTVPNPVQQVMERGEVVGLANHTVLVARDGREYQIFDSAAPIRDAFGQIVGIVLVFRDVSEKYQAEAALRSADERFRRTFKLIPNPLTLQTPEGNLIDCSDAFCELTGYSREEVLGRDTQAIGLWVDPEQRKAMREVLLRDGQVDGFELKLRRRNGDIRSMELSARYLTLEPEPILLAVAHDITERKQTEESLRQSEARFKTIVATEPECVKVLGAEGELLEMNAAGLAMLEATSIEEVKEHSLLKFILPDYRAAFLALHQQVMAGENVILAFEILGLQGTRRWLETHATPMHDDSTGEIITLLAVTRDITIQKKAELALRESVLHTQAILDNMLDGVITINSEGLIESFNKAACTIFEYSQEEVLYHNISILMPEADKSLHDSHIQRHLDMDETNILGKLREIIGRRKDGSLFPMSLSVSKILREGKATFIGLLRDITQQRQDEEEIYRLAFYDPLTSLPNRRLLFDRLKQAVLTSSRTDQHGALMFLDLDYFKQLNDNLGHDLGDLLLQQVAIRLQGCVREGDSVARMGGDEFVVLLEALSLYPNEAAAQTEAIAHKILASLGRPYTLREHTYVITPSIGIVVFLHQSQSMEELLKKADLAMYQAKTVGRNNARFFDPAMQAAVSVRADLEKSLRKALELNEFVLHYQLQVDGTGTPTGVEALVRWNHSRHGMISPVAFIPLAEETGMILPLGQWVLETACAQLVTWANTADMAHWTMAVNVSVSQFAQTNFVENIEKALHRTGANPRLLKLELTESMLVKDVDDVIVKMFKVKALGVAFSLDDFGTGYSSLSYLKRLPLDQLKIDQSFVRDLLTDPNDTVIARTIIALGHSLSLKVIAEGVETIEQRNALAAMGCDAYQGYYFARPVAAEDLTVTISKLPV